VLYVLQFCWRAIEHLMDNRYQPPLSSPTTLGLSYESYLYHSNLAYRTSLSFLEFLPICFIQHFITGIWFYPTEYACLVNSASCSTSYTHIAVLFLFITDNSWCDLWHLDFLGQSSVFFWHSPDILVWIHDLSPAALSDHRHQLIDWDGLGSLHPD
jgi:hypothetical protein